MKEKEIPDEEDIPVITSEMMAMTDIELTKAWTGLAIGSIMKNRLSLEVGEHYIFLGLVTEERDTEKEDIKQKRRLGWFTPYPLRLNRGGNESEIPVFAWFIDLFDEIVKNE